MPTRSTSKKRSFFGLAALILAIISAVFLGANFEVSQLNITPSTFNRWNNLTAFVYCLTVPIAFILGVLGLRKKNDSKGYSLIAMGLTGVPFLIIFTQFIWSFLR